jgi:hypothetical protein
VLQPFRNRTLGLVDQALRHSRSRERGADRTHGRGVSFDLLSTDSFRTYRQDGDPAAKEITNSDVASAWVFRVDVQRRSSSMTSRRCAVRIRSVHVRARHRSPFRAHARHSIIPFGHSQTTVLREHAALTGASSSESDRCEELLVNSTLLTLTHQSGEIDCGGPAS